MKHKVIKFLRDIFPFILTVALWRLSWPWINPAGILAIIPIFFCSFIFYIPGFSIFALVFCFLLDYKFNTVLTWTMFYCFFYIIINVQNFLDLTHTTKNGLFVFMLFITGPLLCMLFNNISLTTFENGLYLFLLICIMYLPITRLVKALRND